MKSRTSNRSRPPADGEPAEGYGVELRSSKLPLHPWEKPSFTVGEAVAWRALMEGAATPDQQRKVVDWLFWAARHGTVPVVPDRVGGTGLSHDAMLFITGQQAITKWIVDMLHWRPKQSAINDEHGLGT